jgi:hypothetical protein
VAGGHESARRPSWSGTGFFNNPVVNVRAYAASASARAARATPAGSHENVMAARGRRGTACRPIGPRRRASVTNPAELPLEPVADAGIERAAEATLRSPRNRGSSPIEREARKYR